MIFIIDIISIIQIFAKVIERKVSEDMASLKEKLYKTQLNNHPIQKID